MIPRQLSEISEGLRPGHSLAADAELQLLRLLSGTDLKESKFPCAVAHTISLLQQKRPLLQQYLHHQFHPSLKERERLCLFCCEVIRRIRDNPRHSLHLLSQNLQHDRVIPSSETEEDSCKALEAIFASIMALSRVAVPSTQTDLAASFQIDTQGANYPSYASVDWAKADRPLHEMLRCLGETLPRRVTVADEASLELPRGVEAARFFHVSKLNAAVLKKLTNMQFVWVDSITAHLDFNPQIPALYLFRSPSLCEAQLSGNSFLAL